MGSVLHDQIILLLFLGTFHLCGARGGLFKASVLV